MSAYKKYQQRMQEIYYLDSTIANLQWDQEVMMPSSASSFRSRQISYLSQLSHTKFTDSSTLHLMEKAGKESLSPEQKTNIDKSLYDYRTACQLSTQFVKRRSELISQAYMAWVQAREQEKASHFLKVFSSLLDMKREEAELRGYNDHPYDALLNLYDKGLSVKDLDPLFKQLDNELETLIQESQNRQEDHRSLLTTKVPKNNQWDFSLEILKAMGFDFNRGRQDVSQHPFTISLSPDDIRLTTYYGETNLSPIIWGTIHEGGHALYEQGLPKEKYEGLPLSQAASLSIHESQARFWEIQLGKSIPFWEHFYPKLKKAYGSNAPKEDLSSFLKAIHYLTPNLIRTEADELHYHRHIIIRYDIEKQLFEGRLQVRDLEEYWNEQYHEKMGLEVQNPNQGILQDVHWAHGGLGYFPTYTLGSIYAAELYDKMKLDIPNVKEDIERANFSGVLEWLNINVFRHGRKYESLELMKQVLGHPPISSKLTDIYRKKMETVYS